MSARKPRPLSGLQLHVLGVLKDCGTADADEVSRNLLCSTRSASASLVGLERRGLVAPVYTGHRFDGKAYGITDAGEEAYRDEFGDDNEEEA